MGRALALLIVLIVGQAGSAWAGEYGYGYARRGLLSEARYGGGYSYGGRRLTSYSAYAYGTRRLSSYGGYGRRLTSAYSVHGYGYSVAGEGSRRLQGYYSLALGARRLLEEQAWEGSQGFVGAMVEGAASLAAPQQRRRVLGYSGGYAGAHY